MGTSVFNNERIDQKALDINGASVLVLSVNPRRTWALLINNTDVPIYIYCGEPANAADKGILLNAMGASWEINLTNKYFGEVYAFSSAASQLLVTECSYAE